MTNGDVKLRKRRGGERGKAWYRQSYEKKSFSQYLIFIVTKKVEWWRADYYVIWDIFCSTTFFLRRFYYSFAKRFIELQKKVRASAISFQCRRFVSFNVKGAKPYVTDGNV